MGSLDNARETILAVAARKFAHGGFNGAQMAEIAREAGMGVGTLYKHFPSKEALFRAMVDRFLTGLFEATEQVLDAPPASLPEALEAYARTAVQRVEADPLVCRAVAQETLGSRVAFRQVIGAEIWDRIEAHRARVAQFLARRGAELAPGLGPEDAAVFFLGTLWTFVEHDLNHDRLDRLAGRPALVARCVWKGVSP
ncbi:TetR/AcrR family transcriptional regulator [Deferrisoma camini]|uniref:TetR/AcrR family transcriptional regulator n=1 Tax=Deferrisoma camini TaxID=1035120 RepID=UPI00046CBE01|nr:TetR/AcrR family transcriptional regulator [Deferrisoma camini]